MYASERPAHLISDMAPPGRLSHSSVVLGWMCPVSVSVLSDVRHARMCPITDGVHGLGRDELDSIMPYNEGPGKLYLAIVCTSTQVARFNPHVRV